MTPFPEFSVNKVVPLRFAGVDLKLKTSHGLFSSHRVDDGTMLLLKTLAQQGSVPERGRMLDAGCGTGPLAVALKKYHPDLTVVARDRLALAAAYTSENARFNGVDVEAAPGLLLDQVPGPWDLIVSNLPAKAGQPVLADFVARSLGLLAADGMAAVVVVDPLEQWLEDEISRAGGGIVHREKSSGYCVFHYRAGQKVSGVGPRPFPEAYMRGEVAWTAGNAKFYQKTFYGLPNFDGLDYRLQMTLPLLKGLNPSAECLVWEPVQGHLATWAASGRQVSTLHIAGNDLLGLAAAEINIEGKDVALHPVPFIQDLSMKENSVSSALVQLHPEPEIPWAEATAVALRRLLAPGAWALINGTSTDLTRLLERFSGFRVVKDVRSKGWRAVLATKS